MSGHVSKFESTVVKGKGRKPGVTFLATLPIHIILIVIFFIWLAPTLGLLVSSFRPANLIQTSGWWRAFSSPLSFTLDNYSYVIQRSGMGRSFFNSLMITIPSTVLPILAAAFAAYALSWMNFRGRDVLLLLFVALIVIPLQMTFIPILRLFNALNLTGTFHGIWIAHAAYGLPFAIYLLRGFIGSLPGEIFESAYIDGASHFQVFYRLVLPTSVPAIASLTIFQFMWTWNDLLIALLYLGGGRDVAPMTVTVSNLVNSYGSGWHYLTAAAFISMVMPLLVFLVLQRYFIKGITAGAVKG